MADDRTEFERRPLPENQSENFIRAGATACRVIIEMTPSSGAWNMAADEALLESAVAGGACTLRWYRWEAATLSLGYFQSPADAAGNPRLAELPVVRRLSGGGAIVHHHELTYSCTIPSWHALALDPRSLYTVVHSRVIEVLRDFGFTASLRGERAPELGHEFLCFGRGDAFDVVMGPHKVLGSAQRRRKGAVLQHGSLILRTSEWAPGFPGIFDCQGFAVGEADLMAQLAGGLAELLSPRWAPGAITENERHRAQMLLARSPAAAK
ncbi:MAG TPA: hypothetical protein VKU82_03565 [Planctomycetaceae bacterium]|nr:hypothetical protein [Planctomycetaceae bacterium]